MTLRNELIQVAAVAVAAITDLDRGSTSIGPTHRRIVVEVTQERWRQEAKWGERNNVPIAEWLVILGEEYGEACQAALEEVMYPNESANALREDTDELT
jgi:hypothetical protein